jgi:hypothetical protein
MKSHPGFDARLCYGTVSLAFEWSQFEPSSIKRTVEREDIADVQADTNGGGSKLGNSERTVHRWTSMHATGGAVHCALCHGRIWLKSCVQCDMCAQLVHQKCATKAEQSVPCVPIVAAGMGEQPSHLVDRRSSTQTPFSTDNLTLV